MCVPAPNYPVDFRAARCHTPSRQRERTVSYTPFATYYAWNVFPEPTPAVEVIRGGGSGQFCDRPKTPLSILDDICPQTPSHRRDVYIRGDNQWQYGSSFIRRENSSLYSCTLE